MAVVAHTHKPRPDVPRNWLIFNSYRPLHGTKVWEDEAFYGRHYAAVDPKSPDAELQIGHNYRNDAVLLAFVPRREAIKAILAYYKQEGYDRSGASDDELLQWHFLDQYPDGQWNAGDLVRTKVPPTKKRR
jgi:hypothetical protein